MIDIDEPGRVRAGEELDARAVDTFLKGAIPGLSGDPSIQQYRGGASNLTYLVRYPDRELVVRRPPFGTKAKSAHDMSREARFLKALKPAYRYVPTVVAFCDDPGVMGCDFYVMERIRGVILRRDIPEEMNLDAVATRRLCIDVLDRMIELHGLDVHALGLEPLGKGEGYVRRQVTGWSDRYRKAKTDDVGDFEKVMAWLAEKQPAKDVATCVIHNDFRFDNVVLTPTSPPEVIGVLDWEMATVGDPLMELGQTIAYWVETVDDPTFQMMRRQPTNAPGMLTRDEVIAYYAEKTGRRVDSFDFYLIFGLFRLAVIVQQIYYRFVLGQTRNLEFAGFGPITNYIEKRCERLIERSEL